MTEKSTPSTGLRVFEEKAIRLTPCTKKFHDRTSEKIAQKESDLDPAPEVEITVEDVWTELDENRAKRKLWLLGSVFFIIVLLVGLSWQVCQEFLINREIKTIRLQDRVRSINTKGEADERAFKVYQEIRTTVIGYLEAESIEEKLKHVRNPEIAKPRMEKYYSSYPYQPQKFKELLSSLPYSITDPFDGSLHLFQAVKAVTDQEEEATLSITFSPKGPKIDWEAHVIWEPMTWEDYAGLRPEEEMTFRVRAKLSGHYPHGSYDEKKYQCLDLAFPGSDYHFVGYVERKSESGAEIIKGLNRISRGAAMTLKLQWIPENQIENAVLIKELAGLSWVLTK